MDGRDFGPPRSVHVPPPLLAGLAMEQHRLGAAAAAGRIPPSPGHLGGSHPPTLHSGKYLPSPINLHPHHSDAFPAGSSPFLSGYPGPSHLTSDPAYRTANPSSLQMAQLWASHAHEGYPPLPSSLYSSPYLSLGHLDPPSLSQHALYDSHKEGFYLPASLASLHPHPPPSVSSSSTPPQRTSRDSRDKPYRGDRERDRERSREELRPHSVVDLTQDGRGEEERRARNSDRERDTERDGWSVHSHPSQHKSQGSTVESRSRPSPPRPSAPSGRPHGPETENHNFNSLSERQRRNDSVATSAGTLHLSYALPPAPRECLREQRVTAPTYVPSVEVYDERAGPIQIASQARDNKHGDKHRDREQERERDRERERESYRFPERSLTEHPRLSQFSDVSNQREEGSIICSNSSKRGQDASSQSRFSPETRDLSKHSSRLAIERATVDSKWNTISPLANYATSHMAALAAQHGHALSSPHSQPPTSQMSHSPHTAHRTSINSHSHSHSPQTHPSQHGHSEEGSQRRYLDPSVLYRPGGSLVGGSSSGERSGSSDPTEVSAMQSLIKYSGNFSAEGGGSSRLAAEGRGPFGGLGNMVMEEREREKERERDRLSVGSSGSGALRVPPQLKREQERPDSARSFGRDGEGEVRHPPVGIAVAVARQRDSSSTNKQSSGTSDPQRAHLPTGIKDEERGEDRARHHDDRLLGGRLERDQEKVLRESKELAEFTQMHPTPLSSGLTPSMMTPTLMNPNLMVTGGAALSGAGRWPSDPSTLTSHPWMSRPGAPPVWLSSSPYSLGPSSLHQTLPPGYPPSLPGSIPPYQFARDPQSGQLIVIPTEHLSHYGGDVLDRGAPVWSSVYGTGGSLQHAAQLQLLSQQQMLRQQELLMIQQHTAQVLELQRNAQLVERLKASEHRPDVEDKPDKRNTAPKPHPSSIPSSSSSPTLHPRKPPPPSRSPTPSTSSLTPLPPLPSPVTTLKSEEVGQRAHSHPPTPLPHPASPRSASPPPSSPRRPKREAAEDGEVGRREQREAQKPPPAPYQGIYTDIPPGYSYQSITAPFGSHFSSYHIPTPTGSNTEVVPPPRAHSPSKAAPLSAPRMHSRLLDSNNKPQKLESSKTASFLKQEPGVEQHQSDMTPKPLGPLRRSCTPVLPNHIKERDRKDPKPLAVPLNTSSTPPQKNETLEEIREEEKNRGQIKMEVPSFSCQVAYPPPLVHPEAEPKPEIITDPERTRYPSCITADADGQGSAQTHESQEQTISSVCEPEQQDTPINMHALVAEIPPIVDSPLPLISIPDDPMAGMLALLAASEMAQARSCTPPAPTLTPHMENFPMSAHCSTTEPLEIVALEGMALLSQMAQQEMENLSQKKEGLDYLLEASQQILLEAIEKQSHIQLPRVLDPNKKYSWRQRKEEPLFSKMSMDVLDAVEVEYRVRLAELQKTYKEKQREMSKLQRRRDKHERQQEDERRSLTRRGRGRPRKRKHMAPPLKLDSRPGKVGRTVQYSEDSEAGEGQRKRFRMSKEDEEMEASSGVKMKKKKKKSWKDQETSTSLEVLKAKRSHVCEQEQLASDLNRALSLSQLGSLSSSHKLTSNTKVNKSKGKSSESRVKDRSIHAPVKGGKHKISGKTSASEMVQKGKSQKKRSMFSPVRSELSSCSNNSDSEEHISARGGWPPLSNSRARDNVKRRTATTPTSQLSTKKSQKKKHKHLSLLLEEAGLSSSDDSFDQGY